jgi:hypothetical protein
MRREAPRVSFLMCPFCVRAPSSVLATQLSDVARRVHVMSVPRVSEVILGPPVLGGDRPDRRAARQLPASIHAPGADQLRLQPGPQVRLSAGEVTSRRPLLRGPEGIIVELAPRPTRLGEDSPGFVAGSTDAFRAAMIVAAVLAVGGSAAAFGYSRRPGAGLATGAAEAVPRGRLDPAAPDCPSACFVHPQRQGLADLQAEPAATDG